MPERVASPRSLPAACYTTVRVDMTVTGGAKQLLTGNAGDEIYFLTAGLRLQFQQEYP